MFEAKYPSIPRRTEAPTVTPSPQATPPTKLLTIILRKPRSTLKCFCALMFYNPRSLAIPCIDFNTISIKFGSASPSFSSHKNI